jgi:hypothetical protein
MKSNPIKNNCFTRFTQILWYAMLPVKDGCPLIIVLLEPICSLNCKGMVQIEKF